MPGVKKDKLAPISKEVWLGLAKLSESFSAQSPPINLENYAKDSGIEQVRFKPLISDAGLAKLGDKFEIIINTEAPGASPTETTALVGDGMWSKFQSSLRFTVAHEIAHAMFIRAVKASEANGLLEKHRADVEEACRILAGVMLLPRRMLNREFNERMLDLDYMIDLIKAFRVSNEVFIRRLHCSDWQQESGKLDGFIAFVQTKQGRPFFKATHVFGRYATDRFHRAIQTANLAGSPKKYNYPYLSTIYRQSTRALEGLFVNDVKLDRKQDIESLLLGGEGSQLDIESGWGDGDVIPCNMIFRRIHPKPLRILLCVKVAGPVQKPGQRTFF